MWIQMYQSYDFKKKLVTQKQGNILNFNQAIVLLWCSNYDINDGTKPAQTRREN